MAENPYETRKLLSAYLFLHYAAAKDYPDLPLPWEALDFPARSVRELLGDSGSRDRALDIGCAVGRASFELARDFGQVMGIDYSHAFIEAAQRLQMTGRAEIEVADEGETVRRCVVKIPPDVEAARISFAVGDAMNLPETLAGFDLVLAANLICRLPDPGVFLARLPGLVAPGGQLLLTTPFTWLEEYTPKENWLGGRAGDPRESFAVLREMLEPHFVLEYTRELPFLIREHRRKYQYGIALGSRWRRC